MNARECLELISKNQIQPEQLYQYFATQVPKLFILYQATGSSKKPFLANGNHPKSKYVVAFTDVDAARVPKVKYPQYVKLLEEPAVPFLIQAFRSEADGIVINPGLPSRLFLAKPHLQVMIREYAVSQFSQMPGPYIPTMDRNLLLVEYQKQRYTVAIYLREEDAHQIVRQSGGEVLQHSWATVFERCQQLGAPAPFFHFGLPEQSFLTIKHVEIIRNGNHLGYRYDNPIEHPFIVEADKERKELPAAMFFGQIPGRTDITSQSQLSLQAPSQDEKHQEYNPPFAFTEPQKISQTSAMNQQEPSTAPSSLAAEQSEKQLAHAPSSSVGAMDNQLFPSISGSTDTRGQQANQMISESTEATEKQLSQTMADSSHTMKDQVSSSVSNDTNSMEKQLSPSMSGSPGILDQSSPTTEGRQEPYSTAQKQQTQPTTSSYPPHSKPIDPDVEAGLKRLERATIEGQGMGNGWEVCRTMAELRRIWIVVDPEGNMVILAGQDQSPIVDFFTSAEHAQRLIDEARQKNPNLPPMVPRLISTKKLYRALAPRKPIIWINRGSPEAWTSVMGDTLPYVLQLMEQIEREKK